MSIGRDGMNGMKNFLKNTQINVLTKYTASVRS